jgi:hypothetical protein
MNARVSIGQGKRDRRLAKIFSVTLQAFIIPSGNTRSWAMFHPNSSKPMATILLNYLSTFWGEAQYRQARLFPYTEEVVGPARKNHSSPITSTQNHLYMGGFVY